MIAAARLLPSIPAASVLATAMLATFAAATFAPVCYAQKYPTRPVRVIVPFAPGAASDITGRLLTFNLSEGFKQTFLVENRPGAGGNIGHELVARAPADGYTLLLANESLAINASFGHKLPFDTLNDLAPVSLVTINPRVFVAAANTPFASIKELIAAARAKPGSIRFGSSGIGTGPHLAGELLSTLAGIQMVHVPYKGAAPALADVLGGQIKIIATTILSSQSMIQSGKLRALGVTSARRAATLPDVPTVAESGVPDFLATSWLMLLAPAKTPAAIINRVQQETARFMAPPEMRKRIAADGGDPVASTPAQASEHLKSEMARWTAVIRAAGIKPEI